MSKEYLERAKKIAGTCESCEVAPVGVEVIKLNERKRYSICLNCHVFLVSLSLPKEFFKNLLKNGHTTDEFYLHDDFYDEEGRALQPSPHTICEECGKSVFSSFLDLGG